MSGQTLGGQGASLQALVEQQGKKLDAFITLTNFQLKNIEGHVERHTVIL